METKQFKSNIKYRNKRTKKEKKIEIFFFQFYKYLKTQRAKIMSTFIIF